MQVLYWHQKFGPALYSLKEAWEFAQSIHAVFCGLGECINSCGGCSRSMCNWGCCYWLFSLDDNRLRVWSKFLVVSQICFSWAPQSLPIVTNSVCNIYGYSFKEQPRGKRTSN